MNIYSITVNRFGKVETHQHRGSSRKTAIETLILSINGVGQPGKSHADIQVGISATRVISCTLIAPENCLSGEAARDKMQKLLAAYDINKIGYGQYTSEDQVWGFFTEGDKVVAFDNTTNDLWSEEFETEEQAIEWLAI